MPEPGVVPGDELSLDRFRAIVEQSADLLMIADPQNTVRWANSVFERVLGYPPESLVGRDFLPLVHPDDLESLRETIGAAFGRPSEGAFATFRVRAADGTWRWMESSAKNMLDEPAVGGFVISLHDVTEKVEAEEALRLSERRYEELFEHAADTIVIADSSGAVMAVNLAGEQLLGFTRDELVGTSMFARVAPADVEYARREFAKRLAGGDEQIVALELCAKGGRRVFVEVTARFVFEEGRQARMEAIVRDVTEQRLLREQIEHQNFHDGLTGLPNRLLFVDRLNQALARARRDLSSIAVLLLDLDNFKLVNNSLGHDAGDAVLCTLASALREAVRPSDTVARLGADEFAFLVEDVHGNERLVDVAQTILAALGTPAVTDLTNHLSGSLGIAIATAETEANEVIRNADIAMHRAKKENRGSYEIFDTPMRVRVVRELSIENALSEALKVDELALHYQPIVSLADGRLLGVEGIMRWQHPKWGWIRPSEFIPIAEATRLIVPLASHVISAAARQSVTWRSFIDEVLPWGIAINLSPLELSGKTFVATFERLLAEHGARPEDLTIEITERTFIEADNTVLSNNLRALADDGVRLSIDDFGTGYSALASLQRFHFSSVKIDRVFIQRITDESPEAPVTTGVTQLAHNLGITVIAEGVETARQVGRLRELGCEAAQGFYYARPQPAAELAPLLALGRIERPLPLAAPVRAHFRMQP